jgi:regulator of cell morphogenesis and NO signaling
MIDSFNTSTIGALVAADFRRAEVFERFGIDFCCNGRRLLTEACSAADVNPGDVVRALGALPGRRSSDDDVRRWPIPRLIDHVVSVHHASVRSALPVIAQHLDRLTSTDGANHPELLRVNAYFSLLAADLSQHLLKEEHVLFPYIRDLAGSRDTVLIPRSPFGTVENPIRMMEREHAEAGDTVRIIRELTQGYSTPPDGSPTYGIAMAELQQFEHDLRRHVHLENNVLFPAAVRLEQQLTGGLDG